MNLCLQNSIGALFLAGILLASGAASAQMNNAGPIHDNRTLDYQPGPLRCSGGELFVVIERLDPTTLSGDLHVTSSLDGGATWTSPTAIVSSASNERHPSLVELTDSSLALFYLSNATGSFRIHRATSADGSLWQQQGAIDLGWGTGGEINPSVIRESDGSLTMTYQRLSGTGHIARSLDGGATWDTLLTQVSTGSGALPRVTRRESDGLYVVTYQVNPGNNNLQIFSKASYDPYDWSSAAAPVAVSANSHDSQPLALDDGTFLVVYSEQSGNLSFDLYYRTSNDGVSWSAPIQLTSFSSRHDLQAHPILQGNPGHITLFWGHQDSAQAYRDHDIWMAQDVAIQSAN